MESTNVPMSKRLIGIALAAVFIVGSIFIPGSETLGHEGVMTLGLLLALVSLWVTSALPLGVRGTFHHCNVSGFGHRRRLGPGNWRFC